MRLGRLTRVELDELLSYYRKQRQRLQLGELDAAMMIAGEPAKDESAEDDVAEDDVAENDVAEDENRAEDLAAWSIVARALLNLDEVISKE